MSNDSRMLAPLAQRIGNMLARGVVSAVNSAKKMQILQVRLLAGEAKDNVEHFEPFGFTSKPLTGAEHVTVFIDGDRSHAITLVVADRRYRLQNLEDGEVALHDAFGNKAHFKKDSTLDIIAATKVQITSPLVTMSGNLQIAGSITAGTIITAPLVVGTTNVTFGGKSGIGHVHKENNTAGGNTDPPT